MFWYIVWDYLNPWVKIGKTKDIDNRWSSITDYPFKLEVLFFGHETPGCSEFVLHRRFANERIGRTEWFHIRGDLLVFLSRLRLLYREEMMVHEKIKRPIGIRVSEILSELGARETLDNLRREFLDSLDEVSTEVKDSVAKEVDELSTIVDDFVNQEIPDTINKKLKSIANIAAQEAIQLLISDDPESVRHLRLIPSSEVARRLALPTKFVQPWQINAQMAPPPTVEREGHKSLWRVDVINNFIDMLSINKFIDPLSERSVEEGHAPGTRTCG